MKVAIYSRVSTNKQEVGNQINELKDWCKKSGYEIFDVYIDEAYSGSTIKRPDLERMLIDAFHKKFDAVLVWKLDRLGRSLKDLILIVDKLKESKINFISLTQNMDTSTPTGRMIFYIFGAIAEFEKDLISERTKLSLKNAKRKGIKLGRPRISKEKKMRMIRMRKKGLTYRQIADELGVSHAKVFAVTNYVHKTLDNSHEKNDTKDKKGHT